MFQEYKEKFCNTLYWEKAFDVAYEVKNQELSTKEMCVVSFLKAIEYITSKPIDEEKLDELAKKYLQLKILYRCDEDEQMFIDMIGEAFKEGYRKAKEG